MNPVLAFLQLTRWPNLVIIALTQYLMRWCIIRPLVEGVKGAHFQLQISEFHFFLLVLSTVLIAAAGNVINDYFDLRIDRINKPDKIIVGRHIKRRVAMGAHLTMNTLGIVLGTYIAITCFSWKLAMIHVFAAMSLWFYATHFKHQVLLGNLVIAFLAGLVPLIVGLFEVPLLNYRYADILNQNDTNFNFIAFWIIGYAGFAFIMTFAREVTKDMADVKGDETYGSETVPVLWGNGTAKMIVSGSYALVIILLITIHQLFLGDHYTGLYIVFLICVPLGYTMFLTVKANGREQFLRDSTFNKLVSVLGILFSVLAMCLVLDVSL